MLRRSIDYWKEKPVKIIILDGSIAPLEDETLNNSNIKYIYKRKSVHDRLNLITKIETEYASFISDDEYFTEDGLISAIDILNGNPSVSSCGGACISFMWNKEKNHVSTRPHYPQQLLRESEINSTNERIKEHFSAYTPSTIYSLHRSEEFIKIVYASNHSNSCIYSTEFAFEFSSLYLGKSITMKKAYWLRSYENEIISTKTEPRSLSMYQWLTDKKYIDEVTSWSSHIANSLSNDKTEKHKILYLLKLACNEYIQAINRNRNNTPPYIGTPGNWEATKKLLHSLNIETSGDSDKTINHIERFYLRGNHRPHE